MPIQTDDSSIVQYNSFMNIINLNGAWEFRKEDDSSWQPATVPGCVHMDLLKEPSMYLLSFFNKPR
jgi:hypothetical protein